MLINYLSGHNNLHFKFLFHFCNSQIKIFILNLSLFLIQLLILQVPQLMANNSCFFAIVLKDIIDSMENKHYCVEYQIGMETQINKFILC